MVIILDNKIPDSIVEHLNNHNYSDPLLEGLYHDIASWHAVWTWLQFILYI